MFCVHEKRIILCFFYFPPALHGATVVASTERVAQPFWTSTSCFHFWGFKKPFLADQKPKALCRTHIYIRLYVYSINIIQESRGARGYVVKSVTRSGKPFITNCSQTSTRSNDSVAASVFSRSPTASRGFVFHFTRFNQRPGFIPTSKYSNIFLTRIRFSTDRVYNSNVSLFFRIFLDLYCTRRTSRAHPCIIFARSHRSYRSNFFNGDRHNMTCNYK